MTSFAFAATVTGLDVNSTEQLDQLYTDDFVLVPSTIDGLTTIDVEIDAQTGEHALAQFRDHLNACSVTIVRILEDLVNMPEIATRLGVSREAVRTWTTGTRGSVAFPLHREVIGQQKVWPWSAVHAWAVVTGHLPEGEPAPLDADCIDWFNGRLVTSRTARKASSEFHTTRAAVVRLLSIPSGHHHEGFGARSGVEWATTPNGSLVPRVEMIDA